VRLANTLLKDGKSVRDNHVFACNFAKRSPILIFFHSTDSAINLLNLVINNPTTAQICSYTTLQYLSLMACFADINVSQSSVATDARCGGIFDIHLTANLPRNLPVKRICKSVNI